MAKNESSDPHNFQKYGVPFYGAAWVRYSHVKSKLASPQQDPDGSADEAPQSSRESYVVLSGGGGEGRSGIPNALVLSHFDFLSNSLSQEPVSC